MTAIGILGLDTSHAGAFADRLAALDTDGSDPTVAAVWDDGTVRDDEYVRDFCASYGAARYDDPAAMVDEVDAAMVLTVDWDRHAPLARPFLDAGVPTLVDKPVAGSVAALDSLGSAAEEAALFGGSALPFHPDFAALSGQSDERTIHIAGYNDYFYYRVHVADAARRLVGADWSRVAPVAGTASSTVEVRFEDGTWATLRFDGPENDAAFAALDVAGRTRTARVPASEAVLDAMYDPYLEAFLAVVRGERRSSGVMLDAARLSLAVEAALERGTPVEPGADAVASLERPAAPFVAEYEPYY